MEAIGDILREMQNKEDMPLDGYSQLEAYKMMQSLADRLDEAHNRELKAVVDLNETAMKTATDEVERLRAENARLKAELNNDDCLKLANDVDRLRAENARLRSAIVRVHGCLDSTCGSMGVCRTCEFMRAGGAE